MEPDEDVATYVAHLMATVTMEAMRSAHQATALLARAGTPMRGQREVDAYYRAVLRPTWQAELERAIVSEVRDIRLARVKRASGAKLVVDNSALVVTRWGARGKASTPAWFRLALPNEVDVARRGTVTDFEPWPVESFTPLSVLVNPTAIGAEDTLIAVDRYDTGRGERRATVSVAQARLGMTPAATIASPQLLRAAQNPLDTPYSRAISAVTPPAHADAKLRRFNA